MNDGEQHEIRRTKTSQTTNHGKPGLAWRSLVEIPIYGSMPAGFADALGMGNSYLKRLSPKRTLGNFFLSLALVQNAALHFIIFTNT